MFSKNYKNFVRKDYLINCLQKVFQTISGEIFQNNLWRNFDIIFLYLTCTFQKIFFTVLSIISICYFLCLTLENLLLNLKKKFNFINLIAKRTFTPLRSSENVRRNLFPNRRSIADPTHLPKVTDL